MYLRSFLTLAALAVPLDLLLASNARTTVGFLTCTLAPEAESQPSSESVTSGSSREMLCHFSPSQGGAEEAYVGTIQSVSTDGKRTPDRVMIWMVSAPSSAALKSGALQQTYTVEPAAAETATRTLVGDSNNEIRLQSMAEQGGQQGKAAENPATSKDFIFVTIDLKLKSAAS